MGFSGFLSFLQAHKKQGAPDASPVVDEARRGGFLRSSTTRDIHDIHNRQRSSEGHV